ncbi:MAG: hypothetical protein Q9M48_11120 [Rhodobacterales bacterium]|nr:hypothetical protein [Rhodobacterales bacterium]
MLPANFRESGLYAHRVNATKLTQFQVLGERATGTNVVRKLIEKNVKLTRTERLGWKHATPHMVGIPDELLVVCVVRNAEDWARSMHKRPWHADPAILDLEFSQFLRQEWMSIVDRPDDFEEIHPELGLQGQALQYDRHPISGLPFENLFQLRRLKLEAMLGVLNRGCNAVFVQLEMVQSDPERFVTLMQNVFQLTSPAPRFKPVTRRLGNRFRLGQERPPTPEKMNDLDRGFMKRQLDLTIEASLGYDY